MDTEISQIQVSFDQVTRDVDSIHKRKSKLAESVEGLQKTFAQIRLDNPIADCNPLRYNCGGLHESVWQISTYLSIL
jgi:hypothetical protein